jgi:hypothetical protein
MTMVVVVIMIVGMRVRDSRSSGGLRVIVTSQSCYARQGRSGVAHMFYHLGCGETDCKLSTAGEKKMNGTRLA